MFCTLLLTAYHRRGNTLVTVCYRLGTAYKGHSLTWKNVGTVGKKKTSLFEHSWGQIKYSQIRDIVGCKQRSPY